MHLSGMPTLDSQDLARANTKASRGGWLVPAVGLGLLALLGAGVGSYWLLARNVAPRAQSVRFGPLADMPDIKDGVPALVSKPAARIIAGVPTNLPAPSSPVARPVATGFLGRTVLVPRAEPAAPSDPLREAAEATAMASTIASASLRLGLGSNSSEAAARISGPSPAEQGATAPNIVAAATPNPTTASMRGTATVSELPPEAPALAPDEFAAAEADRPIAAEAVPPRARPSVAAAGAPAEPPKTASPLPPMRPATRSAEMQGERAASPRTRPGAASAPSATAGPAPGRGPAQPPSPVEDRAEIFGLPLPGFIPTGRQIREAAGTIVDAVASLPDRF